MRTHFTLLRGALALLLVVSGCLFAVGSTIERNHRHHESAPAKSTETSRRSESRAVPTVVSTAAAPSSATPHSPQNRAPGSFDSPQAGQPPRNGTPHPPQNFRPGLFSEPQATHVTIRLEA